MAEHIVNKNEGIECVKVNYFGGIGQENLELHIAAITNVGRVRTGNEDKFLVAIPDYAGRNLKALFVVADGMGGHDYGNVASAIVVETYDKLFTQGFNLIDTAVAADLAIKEWGRMQRSSMSNLGSTVVALNFNQRRAMFHNIGDSRAYRLRAGRLEQITEDDSIVWQAYMRKRISKDEIATHPDANLILKALGILAEEDSATTGSKVISRDFLVMDRYLLCSDGLWGMLKTDSAIQKILAKNKSAYETAHELVDAANARGGIDNITVIVVDVLPKEYAREAIVPVAQRCLDAITSYIDDLALLCMAKFNGKGFLGQRSPNVCTDSSDRIKKTPAAKDELPQINVNDGNIKETTAQISDIDIMIMYNTIVNIYNQRIMDGYDTVNDHINILKKLLPPYSALPDNHRQTALHALDRAIACSSVDELVQMAKIYHQEGKYSAAEVILGKLYWNNMGDNSFYARVIREKNTGNNPHVEMFAKYVARK